MELVIAALVAGLAKGAGEVAAAGLKDAYAGLRKLVVRRFGGDEKAQSILREFEADPEAYEKPLAKQLEAVDAASDAEIAAAATAVLEAAEAAGISTKYTVQNSGQIGIVGDHGHIDTVTFS